MGHKYILVLHCCTNSSDNLWTLEGSVCCPADSARLHGHWRIQKLGAHTFIFFTPLMCQTICYCSLPDLGTVCTPMSKSWICLGWSSTSWDKLSPPQHTDYSVCDGPGHLLNRLKSGCRAADLRPPLLYSMYTESSAPDIELMLPALRNTWRQEVSGWATLQAAVHNSPVA